MIQFTITSPDGVLTTTPVGAVPGGFRLQIGYDRRSTFKGVATDGTQIGGYVVAGNDWVLLRDDGVATFNARITFQAEKPGPHVFDSVLSGRVALNDIHWTGPIRDTSGWKQLNGVLRVSLPIQFETAGAPPTGASAAVRNTATYASDFADLVKHQFVAVGGITVCAGELAGLELQVSALPAQAQTAPDLTNIVTFLETIRALQQPGDPKDKRYLRSVQDAIKSGELTDPTQLLAELGQNQRGVT